MTWTATKKNLWKLDDATLFPLILLMCGPAPEDGWKFLSDGHKWVHFSKQEARKYRRSVDKYLADNHYAGKQPWTGHQVNNLVRAKSNEFLRWVWDTRYPNAEIRDRNYPPRFRKWFDDDSAIELGADEDD